MVALATIRDVKQGQIRKGLAGAVILGKADATEILTLTTGVGAELAAIPSGPQGYQSLGRISRDAAPTFTPEQEQSEVQTWGELEASRVDAISKTTAIAWTCQDTRKSVLELTTGLDLTQVFADATTGEVQIIEPTEPDITYYRALFLMVDGRGDDAYFIARYCPRFVITTVGEEAWSQENPLVYPFTGRALLDADLGFAVKRFYGGPGWKAALPDSGFVLEPTSISVTPPTATLAPAATQQLAVVDSNSANVVNLASYVSSDPTKATVSSSGLITAVATGSTTVTATYLGLTDTCVVTVS